MLGLQRGATAFTRKCRDIEIGTSKLMGKDPTVVERIMVGVEEQAKEYQILSNQMGKILQGLTRIKHDGQAAAAATPQGDKVPEIKKELCPDTLTKDSTPIEFRKFQRDFLVYYKELYMDKASLEGQKHYLLKCIDAELGERLFALTDATTPIFDQPNNPTKSVMTHLIEEFNRRFPVANRRKDFFLQSQGPQQFTAYID